MVTILTNRLKNLSPQDDLMHLIQTFFNLIRERVNVSPLLRPHLLNYLNTQNNENRNTLLSTFNTPK